MRKKYDLLRRSKTLVLAVGSGRAELSRRETLTLVADLAEYLEETRAQTDVGVGLGSVLAQASLFPGEEGKPYRFAIHSGETMIVLSESVLLRCPCGSLTQVRLRHMNGTEIRNQPRCADCRK